MTSKLVVATALSVLVGSACMPKGPGSGRRSMGGGSGGGTVYRTTARGEAVGGEKGTNSGAPRRGMSPLLVAGLITVGVSYGLTVFVGEGVRSTLDPTLPADVEAGYAIDKLWFPVVGAWAGFAHQIEYVMPACDYCEESQAGTAGILVGAIAQTAGTALIIAGALQTAKGGGGGGGGGNRAFAVVPHGSPDSVGVTFAGPF